MRAILIVFLFATAVRADWTARLVTEGTRIGDPPDRGLTASGSGWKLRFEVEREGKPIVTLFDLRKGELTRFIGEEYEVTPILPDKVTIVGGNPPAKCKGTVADCLRKSGFKQKGTETVNGRRATRWQRTAQWPEDFLQTLWVDASSPEYIPLKQTTRLLGRTVSFELQGIESTPQPPGKFAPPPGAKRFVKPPAMN